MEFNKGVYQWLQLVNNFRDLNDILAISRQFLAVFLCVFWLFFCIFGHFVGYSSQMFAFSLNLQVKRAKRAGLY